MSDDEYNSRYLKESAVLALEELKRRKRDNGIKYYVAQKFPGNPQEEFHKSCKRVRAAFGGNRSGKTVAGACEAVWYATGTHPWKNVTTPNFGRIICTDFTNGIEKVIIPEIKSWMPKSAMKPGREGWDSNSRTMFLKNGSTIEFMSNDQDVDKFASASRHWIWFDEEPKQAIYNECKMRVVDTKGDMWFTMTPVNGMTWVYSDIYERAGVDDKIENFHFDTRKNPYLDEEILDDLVKGMDEAEINMRLGGQFVSLSGLVYKEFNEMDHTIRRFTIPEECMRICAIDPHPRNPTVVLYMAVMDKQHFVSLCKQNDSYLRIKTEDIKGDNVYIVYDEVYPKDSLLIRETASLMKAKEGKDYIRYRLIDWSANAANPIMGRTLRQEFDEHGIHTVLADKEVSNGILKVRERLQCNSLYFFKDVYNAIWETKHYVWEDYKVGNEYKNPKDKPRKKRDHAMDCLRYMCASSPKSRAPEIFRPERKTINTYTGY